LTLLVDSVARWQNSDQKAQKGSQKKKLVERICGRILTEFYQKVAEKGPQKIFKRSSLFLAMITTYNVHQGEIKFDFLIDTAAEQGIVKLMFFEIGRTFS
jgi:hypothetical protein